MSWGVSPMASLKAATGKGSLAVARARLRSRFPCERNAVCVAWANQPTTLPGLHVRDDRFVRNGFAVWDVFSGMFFGTSLLLLLFAGFKRTRRFSIVEFGGLVPTENNAPCCARVCFRLAPVGLVRRIRVIIVIVLGFFLTQRRSANTVRRGPVIRVSVGCA